MLWRDCWTGWARRRRAATRTRKGDSAKVQSGTRKEPLRRSKDALPLARSTRFTASGTASDWGSVRRP